MIPPHRSGPGRAAALFAALVFPAFSALPAGAADAAPAAPLTLEEALETARRNNPEIRAAGKRRDARRAAIPSRRTWEDPRISYERMYSGREKLLGVSQEIPFPGKLYLKGRIAALDAAVAGQDYLAKELEVRSKVKSAYAMYFLAVKSIDILEENVELMRRFSKVAESKYSVGKVSQTDVLRAQIELSKMLNMMVTLNQEKETSQAMLNQLFNRAPQEPLGPPEEPKIRRFGQSLAQLEDMALAGRPELLGTRAAAERSRKALISGRMEYLPDFMAQVRSRQAEDPAMDGTSDAMIGMTVPLWFWKQKSMADTARADRDMAEAELDAAKNMTRFGVKDSLVKVRTAERLADLYRTSVIPQAEQALEVSEASYRSDRTSFLELIDVQRTLLQFRMEHYQHLADYERWLADLERLLGRDLGEEKS
ncbi:MAG: hypothetical protein A2902_07310 [Elusimicrobia bacterium RIFCSPLOWO2_01_FULL_64_13]|nr:MAG: hypothetical protein A2636_02395 [Elusimicrobia bacterium RIFCSPHIGHO2_01_FULL_64_10]OGR94945.1 MAG: hypothetical protein A2902_07310 [Elusimicrobia bacterium RIFCSPLOWO2_01_FULL_64_13]